MRRLTRGALATVPLMLALAVTGCGSGGGDDDPAAASSPSLSVDEMNVKFAQCLREHGVDVPDPEPGRGPRVMITGGVSRETVDKAMEACRQYNPQENGAAPPDPQAEERGRKYAECMRKNGVEKFPDPEPGQRGVRIDGDIAADPDFKKAQEQCKDLMSGGSPTGGR